MKNHFTLENITLYQLNICPLNLITFHKKKINRFSQHTEIIPNNLLQNNSKFPPVRDKIFNKELESIAFNVISHFHEVALPTKDSLLSEITESSPKGTTFLEDENCIKQFSINGNNQKRNLNVVNLFEKNVQPLYSSLIMDSLIETYASEEISRIDLNFLFDYISKFMTFDGSACMLLRQGENIYQSIYQNGLDSNTVKNLHFSIKDKYLSVSDKSKMYNIEELNQKYFLRKRFSSKFFKTYKSFLFLPVNFHGYSVALMFFFKNSKEIDLKLINKEIEKICYELIPIFQRSTLLKDRTKRLNFIERYYLLLKEAIAINNESFIVYCINLKEMVDSLVMRHVLNLLCKKIETIMDKSTEKIIISPAGLVHGLFTAEKEAMPKMIHEFERENSCIIEMKVIRYPDNGNNLYNYMSI